MSARGNVSPVQIVQAAEVIFYSAPSVEPLPLPAAVALLPIYANPPHDTIDL